MEVNRRGFGALAAGAAASLFVPSTQPLRAGLVPVPGFESLPGAELVQPAVSHTVTFDPYSLIIDGTRVPIWSGEMHPFRLPSPQLWPDILQKLRANGYNTVCVYVAWNYHSSAPGVYDFTGVRDLGQFLTDAANAGLFVIVRPGPYINAEVDAGGFPGWMTTSTGTARTNNSTYLGHVDEWLTNVDAAIAQHQYTTGGGTVVLYQIENEYASHLTDGVGSAYMAHLYAKVRADGITVPLFHNDKGRNGDWIPGSFSTNGETGRYLYAFDGYPSPTSTPPDWGYFGSGGATGGSTASPSTPGYEAEFGGGWFDPWGGAEFSGQGYAGARSSRDPVYERRFYLTNLANGIKIHNVYMTFGGTSWGWLPAPVVYTSYDYGAAIDEARNQTSKLVPMKQIGLMLETVPDLGKLATGSATSASSSSVKVYHVTNPDTAAHFYFLRNDTTSDLFFTLPVTTSAGTLTVPASGSGIQLNGKDMKVVATGIKLGHRTLLYSTAQPMYQATIGSQDVAALVGRTGDPVEMMLPATSAPTVSVLAGSATSAYDAPNARLRINATLSGLIRILINYGDGGLPLLLLLADDTAGATLWRQPTASASGPVLVRGPALLRTATASGSTMQLTGDTTAAADLEAWVPTGLSTLTWNGTAVSTGTTTSGSLLASAQLPAPPTVTLPALGPWRYAAENPESATTFDDSTWKAANKTSSVSITPIPAGNPVLFADDYGYHYGDVWYRGHYTGTAGVTAISLSYSSGTVGELMAWLDGTPLGVHQQPTPTKSNDTTQTWAATATFAVPSALQGSGAHVLSVLVRPMGHSEDGGANDAHKAARGLTGAAFTGATPTMTWLITGGSADPVRGPMNNGGLYGERNGWHLPTFDDSTWSSVTFPRADTFQGVRWYRTTFTYNPPTGVDASIGLTLTDDSTRAYRMQIFLNGWNLGQYINNVGPQHTFVLPTGILQPQASNTLALAVLASGTTPAGPGTVSLTLLGSVLGGV
ncbi:MAG TPA: beta-galactosidase [Actinocrinis sp.]|uniref:beta-galactosidase n=1 Tax=Actinocrinis sp. TaxID=1920516 RepID=UPI002DDD359E|nr:beta-galactosidase [Actinocrinis sp.]HEV2342734.1 beta-galactosidase [Actinocrinis sp.]